MLGRRSTRHFGFLSGLDVQPTLAVRRLRLEMLESRNLLAVAVDVTGGEVRFFEVSDPDNGGGADDALVLSVTADGLLQYSANGAPPTTDLGDGVQRRVTDVADGCCPEPFVTHLHVDLGGGNDQLVFADGALPFVFSDEFVELDIDTEVTVVDTPVLAAEFALSLFGSRVILNQDTTIESDFIQFFGPVDGATDGPWDLSITAGEIAFSDDVGANTALDELSVNGISEFFGSPQFGDDRMSVTTLGDQQYSEVVTLLGNQTFSSAMGSITFENRVDFREEFAGEGPWDLTVAVPSEERVTFKGAVGHSEREFHFESALNVLTINGPTEFNISPELGDFASVTTLGGQTYNGPVELGQDTFLTSAMGSITFESTVDSSDTGPWDLTAIVAADQRATFNGAVGGGAAPLLPIGALMIDGPSEFNIPPSGGNSISTVNGQTYNGPAELNRDTVLFSEAGNIEFFGPVDASPQAAAGLTVTTETGNNVFRSTVGQQNALAFLLTDQFGIPTGNTEIGEDLIRTTANQIYNDPVVLSSDTTLEGGNISFQNTVSSQDDESYNLEIATSGTTTFNGPVSGLGNLTTGGGAGDDGTVIRADITTVGFQEYGNAVELGNDLALTSEAIVFEQSVNGPFDLTVNVHDFLHVHDLSLSRNGDASGGDLTVLVGSSGSQLNLANVISLQEILVQVDSLQTDSQRIEIRNGTIAADVRVTTGANDDVIVIEGVDAVERMDATAEGDTGDPGEHFRHDVEVDTGDGDDTVLLRAVMADSIQISTGAGEDNVGLFGPQLSAAGASAPHFLATEDVVVRTGAAQDRVAVCGVTTGRPGSDQSGSGEPPPGGDQPLPGLPSSRVFLIDTGEGQDVVGVDGMTDFPQRLRLEDGTEALVSIRLAVDSAEEDDQVQLHDLTNVTISAEDQQYVRDDETFTFDCDAFQEVPQTIDLSVTQVHAIPSNPRLIHFTVSIGNDPLLVPATGVAVENVLSEGLELVSATPSHGAFDLMTGIWNVGTVLPGEMHTLTVMAFATSPGFHSNMAQVVAADQADMNPENDQATEMAVAPATLGNFVWLDADRDGLQGPEESGAAGVTVRLYRDNGDGIAEPSEADELVATTVTPESGFYSFDPLPGEYFLEFVAPDGQPFTEPHAGEDDAIDSDADPETGLTPVFTLAFEDMLTWDAGLVTLDVGSQPQVRATVSGDFNCDGTVEQGDLDLVLLNWGQDAPLVALRSHSGASESIDQAHLDQVLLNWGATSALAAPADLEPLSERQRSRSTAKHAGSVPTREARESTAVSRAGDDAYASTFAGHTDWLAGLRGFR